jgi:hypothetical protein
MDRALGTAPALTVVERPAGADLQHEKILAHRGAAGGCATSPARVVHPNAVVLKDGSTQYGTYDIYVPENTDERLETTFYDGFRERR